MSAKLICLLLPVLSLLVGCSRSSDFSEVKSFVAASKAKPAGVIEPLPQLKSYDTFTYSVADLRSPFSSPTQIVVAQRDRRDGIQPNFNRPKESLEKFDIEQLSMVGTMANAGEETRPWALVYDGSSGVHRVQVGYYIGKNHGRIIQISNAQIDIVEIVPDGDNRWVERPRALKAAANTVAKK